MSKTGTHRDHNCRSCGTLNTFPSNWAHYKCGQCSAGNPVLIRTGPEMLRELIERICPGETDMLDCADEWERDLNEKERLFNLFNKHSKMMHPDYGPCDGLGTMDWTCSECERILCTAPEQCCPECGHRCTPRTVPAEVREAARVIHANHYLQSGAALILARFIQQLDGKGGDDE